MKRRLFDLVALFAIFISPVSFAGEYKFDISEIEKKPYYVGGYAEIRPVLFLLDRDAALFKLRFLNGMKGKQSKNTMADFNWREAMRREWPGFLPG